MPSSGVYSSVQMRLLEHRPPCLSTPRPWTTVEDEMRPEAAAPEVHPFDPRPFHPHHRSCLPPHIGGSGACTAEESDPESFPWIPADASNQPPRSFLSVGILLPIKDVRRKAFGLDDEGGGARGPSAAKRVQTRLRSAREARPRRARWRNACGKVLGRTTDAEEKPTGDGSLLADRTVRWANCTEDVDARVRTW